MGLIKEPKNIDLVVQSKPWTEKELAEFREIMRGMKSKGSKKKYTTARVPGVKKRKPEPDIVINSRPLTDEDREVMSKFIRKSKEKAKLKKQQKGRSTGKSRTAKKDKV